MSLAGESLNLWLEDLHNDQVGLRLRVRECLHASSSPFQRIAVYDTPAFGRVLTLGGAIALTDVDEAVYSELVVHPALQAMPDAKRVLILGGGDGGVAREVLRYPVEQVTVVEIDRQVVETCQRFFPTAAGALGDPRVQLVIDDAHRWLHTAQTQYDVIIVDACELVNPASDAFHQVSFAHMVFQRLAQGGILIAPLGSPDLDADACRATIGRLRERFTTPRVYLAQLPSLPAGLLAIAWCSETRTPTVSRATPFTSPLRAWTPELQASLFGMPKHLGLRLGL